MMRCVLRGRGLCAFGAYAPRLGLCAKSAYGWMNKIYWGDNLQVMSHLLKEFRGKVDLIYINPPFDSKADYKKTIFLRGKKAESDTATFEEKQYGDIWTNDEYLQFMYERLILCRELLSDTGSIYLHCDWHKSHYLRGILDEVFGTDHFWFSITSFSNVTYSLTLRLARLHTRMSAKWICTFACMMNSSEQKATILRLVLFYALKQARTLQDILFSKATNNYLQQSTSYTCQAKRNLKPK